jgi:hypothetical protein
MLKIHNYNKLEGRFLDVTGGWGVEYCNEFKNTYAIGVTNPAYYSSTTNILGVGVPIINRKEFHLSRTLESLGNGEWRYFFYYANKKIEFCVDADYIKDMGMMIEFLSKIVNKYT